MNHLGVQLKAHPFATTEFSRAESAKDAGPNRISRTTLTWPPQMEATRRRSHLIKDGYQYTGVPPSASNVSFASGQQSTNPPTAGPLVDERTRLRTPLPTSTEGSRGTADGGGRAGQLTKRSPWSRQRAAVSVGQGQSNGRACIGTWLG
jgi:hypothetical protein